MFGEAGKVDGVEEKLRVLLFGSIAFLLDAVSADEEVLFSFESTEHDFVDAVSVFVEGSEYATARVDFTAVYFFNNV